MSKIQNFTLLYLKTKCVIPHLTSPMRVINIARDITGKKYFFMRQSDLVAKNQAGTKLIFKQAVSRSVGNLCVQIF
jgi:hypothetical protein